MNSLFLRAKHWQIFIPLLVIPLVTMIVFGMVIASILIPKNPARPEDALWITYCMPFVIAICSFVQFAWFWNILTKLSTLIPSDKVQMPVKRTRLFFVLPIIYFCSFPLFISFIIGNGRSLDPTQMVVLICVGILIFFLHLFCIFCVFHTIYFAAKTIRSAELQRNAPFLTLQLIFSSSGSFRSGFGSFSHASINWWMKPMDYLRMTVDWWISSENLCVR